MKATEEALLTVAVRHLLADRCKSFAVGQDLAKELVKRSRPADVIVLRAPTGEVWVQFFQSPFPVAGQLDVIAPAQAEVKLKVAFLEKTVLLTGPDLRWAVLQEMAERLPPWARTHLSNSSQIAQRVEFLLAGKDNAAVRVAATVARATPAQVVLYGTHKPTNVTVPCYTFAEVRARWPLSFKSPLTSPL